MVINLVISGCCGRMGRRIATLALGSDSASAGAGFAIAGALEGAGHEALGRDYGTVLSLQTALGVAVSDDAETSMRGGDVVIEFTAPGPTVEHVRVAEGLRKPMVIGTTGLSEAQVAAVRAASKTIPIVLSPNMSVGVTLLFELAGSAAARLGRGYDVEIVESHHRQKQDAPSGTAKRLAAVVAAARGQATDAIPVHAIRAGDIIGEHTVVLAGPSERLELTHRAQSRDVFARGALAAARFVRSQRAGLYDMTHVLKAAA